MYNIFISHSWSYSNNYETLINFLKSYPRFEFRDYSVPKNDPLRIYSKYYESELKNKIRKQMIYCNVIIVLAGVYASYSDSINMEILIAKELGKPILAIEPWGSEKTSIVVKNSANLIVKWNKESIINAIRQLSI